MKVSQRFHNETYAPGIATYGINGKTGEQGLPGTSMFFTDYSLPGELLQFAQKITSRKLPIKTEITKLCDMGKVELASMDELNDVVKVLKDLY